MMNRARRLSWFCAASALLHGCGWLVDFDELSSERWRVDGAPAGVVELLDDKCMDAVGCGNKLSKVQLCECDRERPEQQWTLGRDDTVRALGQCLDLLDGTDERSKLQLSACNGSPSQAWVALNGQLFNSASRKCLDVSDHSAASGTPLQLGACAQDNEHQHWRLPRDTGAQPALFGPNVLVFEPSASKDAIQRRLNAVFTLQERNEFGSDRYALLFKPGRYENDVNVGFYTHVVGLGLHPDDVHIRGAVHVEADWNDAPTRQNATKNFWRAVENLTVEPLQSDDRWAAAQASWYRRVHLLGDLRLDDGGWASGGFLADSRIDGTVYSGSQQQWFSRNSQWAQWNGGVWNMVFVGDINAPASNEPPNTTVRETPRVREKPYLFIDAAGEYQVFVPAIAENTQGTSWQPGQPPTAAGEVRSVDDDFVIIKQGDNATALNDAFAAGKSVIITPGVYTLDEPLRIEHPDTVVLGLGFPTLVAQGAFPALAIDNAADGVILAGLIFDAGPENSPVLLQVSGSGITLHDLCFRIGGASLGRATTSLQIDADDVIADNIWAWRADHGQGSGLTATVGWNANTADHGVVVNGDGVTIYGLFVEHYQKQQVLWNGNDGHTYFFMSEAPYDVPSQSAWLDGDSPGFATYEVGDAVTSHDARGLAGYCNFAADMSVVLSHAFQAPAGVEQVALHNMVTVSLGGIGTIQHVVNDTGDSVSKDQPAPVFVTRGP